MDEHDWYDEGPGGGGSGLDRKGQAAYKKGKQDGAAGLSPDQMHPSPYYVDGYADAMLELGENHGRRLADVEKHAPAVSVPLFQHMYMAGYESGVEEAGRAHAVEGRPPQSSLYPYIQGYNSQMGLLGSRDAIALAERRSENPVYERQYNRTLALVAWKDGSSGVRPRSRDPLYETAYTTSRRVPDEDRMSRGDGQRDAVMGIGNHGRAQKTRRGRKQYKDGYLFFTNVMKEYGDALENAHNVGYNDAEFGLRPRKSYPSPEYFEEYQAGYAEAIDENDMVERDAFRKEALEAGRRHKMLGMSDFSDRFADPEAYLEGYGGHEDDAEE